MSSEAQRLGEQAKEQAQVYASAWSLVGGPFDSGQAFEDAGAARHELNTMIDSLVELAQQADGGTAGARYVVYGKGPWHKYSVRTATGEAVCTCAYNPGTYEDKVAMAQRIVDALNATPPTAPQALTEEQISNAMADIGMDYEDEDFGIIVKVVRAAEKCHGISAAGINKKGE
jgi:hypothetical protein